MLLWCRKCLQWQGHLFAILHFRKLNLKYQLVVSPTQTWVLQRLTCLVQLPLQSAPPFTGLGLSQRRLRKRCPVPQVTGQSDQGDHWPQAPFTMIERHVFPYIMSIYVYWQQLPMDNQVKKLRITYWPQEKQTAWGQCFSDYLDQKGHENQHSLIMLLPHAKELRLTSVIITLSPFCLWKWHTAIELRLSRS